MHFDAIVTNPGRLQILTALAVEERQEFVQLRRRTLLTDGNLSSHGRRLQGAGLVAIDKTFRDGKPVTQFRLTPDGRRALESHVRRLMSALSTRRIDRGSTDETARSADAVPEQSATDQAAANDQPTTDPEATLLAAGVEDDWVD